MTLLVPLAAGLALLAGVPVLIHLLNRRRHRRVQWAAMRFLLKVLKRNQRRLQVRDLILMALRALAVAAFALALARPVLSAKGGGGDVTAVVVLDASASMGYRATRETRAERAQGLVAAAVAALPAGARAALVALGPQPEAVIALPTAELTTLPAAAAKVAPGDGAADVPAGLELAWEILKRSGAGERQIILVSDVQAANWPARDEPRLRRLLDAMDGQRPRLVVLDAGAAGDQPANVQVHGLACAEDLPLAGGLLPLTAQVANHGGAPAENVAVDCWLTAPGQAEAVKVASQVVPRLDGTASVEFLIKAGGGGVHRIEARLAGDRLDADDRARLCIDVVERLPVLVVDGRPGTRSRPWSGASDYLRAALAPSALTGAPVAKGAAPPAPPVAVTAITPAGLTGRRLADFRAIVLCEPGELAGGAVDALRAYVRGGGGLLVFTGQGTRGEVLSRQLGGPDGVLPGSIGPAQDAPAGGMGFATAAPTHPAVAAFAAEDLGFLARPRIARHQVLAVGESEKDSAVALRFANGMPAIVERRAGDGVAVVAAFAADRSWSDLPLRPLYPALVLRLVQHAALGVATPRTVIAGQPLVERLPAGGGALALTTPDGATVPLTPETDATTGRARALITRTGRAGFYRLAVAGAAEKDARWLAVNADPAESGMEALDRDALARRFPGLDLAWVAPGDDPASVLASARGGSELWPWLMALAIAAIAAECVLRLRWAPREWAGEKRPARQPEVKERRPVEAEEAVEVEA